MRRKVRRAPHRRSKPIPPDLEFPERRHLFGIPGLDAKALAEGLNIITLCTGAKRGFLLWMAQDHPTAFCRLLELAVFREAIVEIQARSQETGLALRERLGSLVARDPSRHALLQALAMVLYGFIAEKRLNGFPTIASLVNEEVKIPAWLAFAYLRVVFESVYPRRPGRGRHAREARQFEDERIQAARATAVATIRDLTGSKEESFETAAEYLRGSYAQGTEASMRRAWLRSRKRLGARHPIQAPLVAFSLKNLVGRRTT